MTSHSRRKHAFCGASSASRWMKCPGSLYLGHGLRTPVKSWTIEGTRGHELAEKMIARWQQMGTLDQAFIDQKCEEYKDTEEPDEWSRGCRRRNMALYCAEYVGAVEEELKIFISKPNIMVEKQLDLDADLHMFGTLDFFATGYADRQRAVGTGFEWISNDPIGLIVDFKYGKGVQVVAGENWQLAYYACMLAKNSRLDLDGVKVVIFQPRADIKKSSVFYTKADLADAHARLRSGAIKAIYQAAVREPELHAGEHCRFCAAKDSCQEYADFGKPKAEPAAAEPTREIVEDQITTTFTDLE